MNKYDVTDKFKGVKYADITVPEGGSFDDLVALKGNKNIGEGIDKVIAKLAEAGNNNLRGVIDNAHFNDESKLGKGQEIRRIKAHAGGAPHLIAAADHAVIRVIRGRAANVRAQLDKGTGVEQRTDLVVSDGSVFVHNNLHIAFRERLFSPQG